MSSRRELVRQRWNDLAAALMFSVLSVVLWLIDGPWAIPFGFSMWFWMEYARLTGRLEEIDDRAKREVAGG